MDKVKDRARRPSGWTLRLNGLPFLYAISMLVLGLVGRTLLAFSVIHSGLAHQGAGNLSDVESQAVKVLTDAVERLHTLKSLTATCIYTNVRPADSGKPGRTIVIVTKSQLMKPKFALQELTIRDRLTTERQWRPARPLEITVADGRNCWDVNPSNKTYQTWAPTNSAPHISIWAEPLLSFFDRTAKPFLNLGELRREGLLKKLDITKEPWKGRNYRVVRLTHQVVGTTAVATDKFFIDKDGLIKVVTSTGGAHGAAVTFELTNLKLNPSLKPSRFAYRLPSGYSLGHEVPMKSTMLDAGKAAPAFDLPVGDGSRFSLRGFRGKVVVLNFWATWCENCMQEMPVLNKLAGDNPAVVFLSVSVGDTPKAFQDWIATHKEFPSLQFALDPGGINGKGVDAKYRVSGLPTTYVIGADGKIKASFLGFGSDGLSGLQSAMSQ